MKNISPPVSPLSPMVLLGEGSAYPGPHSAADGGPGAKGLRYLSATWSRAGDSRPGSLCAVG